MIGHRHKPDVDIQSDLVALMSERKRTATGLRHIADQNSLPACSLGRERGETFEELHQRRVTPIAITRQPHDLPRRSDRRKFNAPLKTAARVITNRQRPSNAWQFFF